jgi:hypothetical protein
MPRPALSSKFSARTIRHQLHSATHPVLNDPPPSSITLEALDIRGFRLFHCPARHLLPVKRARRHNGRPNTREADAPM